MINIVLLEPEIPQNTGNIIRSAAATGARLHLIKPLGFSLEDKFLKRAGLDYFDLADVVVHECYEDFLKVLGDGKIYYASTKAALRYDEADYSGDCYVMFGRETVINHFLAGNPPYELEEYRRFLKEIYRK